MTDQLLDAVRDHWDGAAGGYDGLRTHGLFSESERRAWCTLLERLLPAPPCRVLDVGTGTGFLAFRLAELGHVVVGIDVSNEMLDAARARAGDRKVEFVEASSELDDPRLSGFSDLGGFDAIVSRHLLWTLVHPEATLRRWRDAIKPGGIVVAIDGTWFARSGPDRLLAALGHAVKVVTRAPSGHKEGVYSRCGPDVFPLFGARSPVPAHNAFERAGLVDVRSEYLDGIDAVERDGMGFADRCTYRSRRFVVEGRAPR